MENTHTKKQETSAGQVKKGNGVKRLPMAGLGLGTISTAFTTSCLMMFGCASSSSPSTPSEIAAQKEFQDKLNVAQNEYQQKVDAATKEAGEREKELHKKTNTAQEEFLRKLDIATKEEKQKLNSTLKLDQKVESIGK